MTGSLKFAFVSVDRPTLLRAVAAVMACVPKPWTRRMVVEAVILVLHQADEWRLEAPYRIEHQELVKTFLRRARRKCPDAFCDDVAPDVDPPRLSA